MRFDVFTIFPDMFRGPLDESIFRRAVEQELLSVHLHNIRNWSTDRHRSVDDYPYGGGPGMVMMAPPIVEAVETVLGDALGQTQVVILSPAGELFDQRLAGELAREERLALICGRYEGIDDRVRQILRAREISIGDYVMTGGELAAMVVMDVVGRLVPGVIEEASLTDESHSSGLLEAPHFTRPAEFRGIGVPDVLLSGHHARVADWRRQQSLRRTQDRRPDLFARIELSDRDRRFLSEKPGGQGAE